MMTMGGLPIVKFTRVVLIREALGVESITMINKFVTLQEELIP